MMNSKAFDNKSRKKEQDSYLKIYMNKNNILIIQTSWIFRLQ